MPYPYLLPIVLVALGGAGIVLLREARVVFACLLVQWIGLVWATAVLGVAPPGIFGINEGSATELVTALTCVAILALRPSFKGPGRRPVPDPGGIHRQKSLLGTPHPPSFLLAGAAALLAGLAGAALSLALPLGQGGEAESATNLVFYWTALAGALALVLEGGLNPVKLAVGLIALFNAASFLINVLSVAPPSPAVLGLAAAARIALAALMAYGWALLLLLFKYLSLEPLFASKEEWAGRPGSEDTGQAQPKQLESPIPTPTPEPTPEPGPLSPVAGSHTIGPRPPHPQAGTRGPRSPESQ